MRPVVLYMLTHLLSWVGMGCAVRDVSGGILGDIGGKPL